ncbi:MAG: protein YgfX [Acidiferrobacterales bacterium]
MSVTKILVTLHPSPLIGAVMLLTHMSAFAVLFWIDIAIWAKLVLAILVLVSLADVFKRVVLRRAGHAVTTIELDSENNMKLIYRSGRQARVSRLRSTFISPVVTLFTVEVENKIIPQSLVIAFDAVDKEQFRQLRVKLKKA